MESVPCRQNLFHGLNISVIQIKVAGFGEILSSKNFQLYNYAQEWIREKRVSNSSIPACKSSFLSTKCTCICLVLQLDKVLS